MDKTLFRSFQATFERQNIDAEKRTVEISFSSEAPVMRGGWREVLSHDPTAVNLTRLNDGGPLLLHHDTHDQIGVVERAWIEGGKGRAVVRFSRSGRAQEAFQDVLDGIRRNVSVGYVIEDYEEDDETRTLTATRWTPYEVSLVPVPADNSVGVNRAQVINEKLAQDQEQVDTRGTNMETNHNSDNAAPAAESTATVTVIREVAEATRRAMEIAERQGVNIEALANRLSERNAQSESPVDQVVSAFRTLEPGRSRAEINLDYRAVASIGGFGLTNFDRPGTVRPFDSQQPTLGDLIPVYATSGSTIREIVETANVTPGASETDESGDKPDQTFAIAEVDFPVEAIAAVVVVTRQLLEDQAAVASYIQNRLPLAVRQRLEQQIINGTGTGAPRQLKGILNTSGIQTQAYSVSPADSILAGIVKVEKFASRVVNAVLMNPTDWELIRKEKATDGHYVGGSWAVNLPPTIWGKLVVLNSYVPAGRAIVGDFATGCGLHVRSQLSLDIADRDWQLMSKNQVGLRAEMRGAFVVNGPKAFCDVDLTP
jgi:HK97 family phage major capsid protein